MTVRWKKIFRKPRILIHDGFILLVIILTADALSAWWNGVLRPPRLEAEPYEWWYPITIPVFFLFPYFLGRWSVMDEEE